jgi:alpha-2-macroglobulin
MKARGVLLSLAVVTLAGGMVRCGGADLATAPNGKGPAVAVPFLLGRTVPEDQGRLVFPPPLEGRRIRPELSEDLARIADRPLHLTSPELDERKEFQIYGKTLRFEFNQAMKGAKPGAAAGDLVHIEPAVPGLATWESATTLTFEAAKYFNPERSYSVLVPALESETGKKLEAPIQATFKSSTGGMIAGKEIGYVPVVGHERIVAMAPFDGEVGPSGRFTILWDQAMHLDVARTLVTLTDGDEPVPFGVRHDPSGVWSGEKVPTDYMVEVVPRRPLARGHAYTLVVRDRAPDPGEQRMAVTVASPLELVDVTCSWWHDGAELCEFENGTLRTDRREVHVRFNHRIRIDNKKLAGHVRVTPFVRNLVVGNESWDDGHLVLTGDFKPSQHYRVVISALLDRFGQRLERPVEVGVNIAALGASVTMPEGLVVLDEQKTKAFTLTSRNVAEAELRFWRVDENDADAFRNALAQATSRDLDRGDPDVRLPVTLEVKRDDVVETAVDLRGTLAASSSWLATIEPTKLAFDAPAVSFPEGSAASRAPVALLRPGSAATLAVYAHSAQGATVVQVARQASGEPVAGAHVKLDGRDDDVVTDGDGVALLPVDTRDEVNGILRVHAGEEQMLLPLGRPSASAEQLFPELGGGEHRVSARRGVIVTDRGVYRPGTTVEIKGTLFGPQGSGLRAVPGAALLFRVVSPTDREVCRHDLTANEMGSGAFECPLPPDAEVGMYRIELLDAVNDGAEAARSSVRVAAFEPPRFKVDVSAQAGGKGAKRTLQARVEGRYLFGAGMDGASVAWTVTRTPAEPPPGPLSDAGLRFDEEHEWWEDESQERWSQTGSGVLDKSGALAVSQAVDLSATSGPQRFAIEADVTDASYRQIAGRTEVVVHPSEHYAGIKGPQGWVGVGQELPLELGVVDTGGKPIAGVTVVAKLMREDWRYQQRRGPNGALQLEWQRDEEEMARCSAKSALTAVPCQLTVPRSGDYRVVAEVDGRRGGSLGFWAWRDGDNERLTAPGRGNVVTLAPDKARYRAGDTAKVLVLSPYPAATAVVTVESGRLLRHFAKRINGGAGVLELPIEQGHAPHVHMTATLLPIGATGADAAGYRVGAVRLPVALDGAALEVAVSSDRPSYRPGDDAEVSIQVTDDGRPEANAEVALAVVDEGVLRLTNHHAVDPIAALWPETALDFVTRSSRQGLADLYDRTHVAGDGGSEETNVTDTRRKFVATALWKPQVRTDANGRATVRFKLPDNLTEFRMMAVALDDEGKGGRSERSFVVTKPVLLEPVLPRFAYVGDSFELAAMVHNTGAAAFQGSVVIDGQDLPITLEPGANTRVGLRTKVDTSGERKITMELRGADGEVHDRVEKTLQTTQPGTLMKPALAGAFAGSQDIDLRVPDGVLRDDGDSVIILVGEHLWPELGGRLEYLLQYPHGCVEQTTSSTLPLIAGREILPRIGVYQHDEKFFRERILAGLQRLGTMRTSSGGLAYWPGGGEPSVYGTAYAIRAVIGAKKAGIEGPSGMLAGMQRYLEQAIRNDEVNPMMRAVIAESLAQLGGLPEGIADTLFERRSELDLFGKASLALALAHDAAQRDRVDKLLDELESVVGDDGAVTDSGQKVMDQHEYFGSYTRTEAQIARALGAGRRGSLKLPVLLRRLADSTEGYTTQTTAFALIALADHLANAPDRGADVRAFVDGKPLAVSHELPGGGRELRIPVAELAGREATLRLEATAGVAMGFLVRATWREPIHPQSYDRMSGLRGPDVYRFYSKPDGTPIDLSAVKAGDMVRVALLVRYDGARDRDYLAVTDLLPAGFEPVDPDLATVSSAPELVEDHPLYSVLRWGGANASHVEMRDDRVQVYFDQLWGSEVAATYLARATTPGHFALPPATAEFMYEAGTDSYSAGGEVVIQ